MGTRESGLGTRPLILNQPYDSLTPLNKSILNLVMTSNVRPITIISKGTKSLFPHPYLTRVDSLKIGRMTAIATKPTTEPMMTIMIGSIMLVTVLIASRSCLA